MSIADDIETDKPEINSQILEAFELAEQGEQAEASKLFHSIPQEAVADLDNLAMLGKLAAALGERIIAINIFNEIVENHSDDVQYMLELAEAYINNNMLHMAEKWLAKALQKDPEDHRIHIKKAHLAFRRKQFTQVIDGLEAVQKTHPEDPEVYPLLISCLIRSNRSREAEAYTTKLIEIQPDRPDNYHLLGRIYNEQGEFEKSRQALAKAIEMRPTYGNAYYDMTTSRKISLESDDGRNFVNTAEGALDFSMSSHDRACIHHSLGKVYNDNKLWDKAFDHYRQGNLIRKPVTVEDTDLLFYEKSYKLFTPELFKKAENIASDSHLPVFVVGMPRSGSTLIERIIAAHPDADGAGESSDINRLIQGVSGSASPDDFSANLLPSIEDGSIAKYVDIYLNAIRAESGNEHASRIVDKQLNNFLFLGFLHALYPNSTIIHARRSMLDSALSCYFQAFQSLGWTNDLDSIAERFIKYRKIMEYWNKVLPEGRIIDVHYENVTSDPENEARRIIDAIGLEWDPVCLDFHKQKSSVATASLWQVRQPLYTSSQKRWLGYARHLEDFANATYEYLDDSDIEAFEQQGIKLKKKGWLKKLFA